MSITGLYSGGMVIERLSSNSLNSKEMPAIEKSLAVSQSSSSNSVSKITEYISGRR